MSIEAKARRTEADLAETRRHTENRLREVLDAARIEVVEARRLGDVETAYGRLDRGYLHEQAEVIREAALALARGGQAAEAAPFLERSLWASLDAMAKAFDEAGLTKAVLEAAAHAPDLRLDRPDLMAAEYDIGLAFLGIGHDEADRIGFGRTAFEDLLRGAEKDRHEDDLRPTTSLYAVSATACCRPERIAAATPALALHFFFKQIAVAVMFVANAVAMASGPLGIGMGIISFAAGMALLQRGC